MIFLYFGDEEQENIWRESLKVKRNLQEK